MEQTFTFDPVTLIPEMYPKEWMEQEVSSEWFTWNSAHQ